MTVGHCVAVKADEWCELSDALDRMGIKHVVLGHDSKWDVIRLTQPTLPRCHTYDQALATVGVFE